MPWGHNDMHDCKHGNMRNGSLVSDRDIFELNGHKYGRGESSHAEMCDQFCKSQGRGHLHVEKCKCKSALVCVGAGSPGKVSRVHVMDAAEKYEIEADLDEVTHDEHWEKLGWKDPCTIEDQLQFKKCGARCPHPEHTEAPGNSEMKEESIFCTLDCFHEPLRVTDSNNLSSLGGYVTSDGHHFPCSHTSSVYHILFVIDRSGSMAGRDCAPDLLSIKNKHDNRLGAVYEACHMFVSSRINEGPQDRVTLVPFDHEAHTAFHAQDLRINMILDYVSTQQCAGPRGGTSFASGLDEAIRNINAIAPRGSSNMKENTMIIFLSDGQDGSGGLGNQLASLTQLDAELITILFGRDGYSSVLEQMAAAVPRGKFVRCIDDVALCETFSFIAESLKNPRIGVVCREEPN